MCNCVVSSPIICVVSIFVYELQILKLIKKNRSHAPWSTKYKLIYLRCAILVPRAYDPSGLRQESRALGATISGMRHR